MFVRVIRVKAKSRVNICGVSAPLSTVALDSGQIRRFSRRIGFQSVDHPLWFSGFIGVFVDMALLYLLSDPTTPVGR